MTTDDTIRTDELTIEVREVERLPLVLHQNWIHADGEDGLSIDLNSSAGLGSGAITLTVKRDDETIYQGVANAADILRNWVDIALKEPDATA